MGLLSRILLQQNLSHESNQSLSSCGAVSWQHSEVRKWNAYSSVPVTKAIKGLFHVTKPCCAGLICLPKLSIYSVVTGFAKQNFPKMLMKLLHPTLVLLWTVCIRSCVMYRTSYSFHGKSSDKCKRTTISHTISQGRLKRKTCWNKLIIVCEIVLFSCAFRQDRVRSILHFMTKVTTSSTPKHQSPISVARLAISGKECL